MARIELHDGVLWTGVRYSTALIGSQGKSGWCEVVTRMGKIRNEGGVIRAVARKSKIVPSDRKRGPIQVAIQPKWRDLLTARHVVQ